MREQEQECDRHDQHGRKTVELHGDAVLADQLNRLAPELCHAEHDAGRDPADRKNSRDHIGPARRAALQGLEHAPDGLPVVVGGGRLGFLGGFRLGRGGLAEKDFLVSRRIAAGPAAAFAGPVDRVGPRGRRRRLGRSRRFAVPQTERILDRRQRCLGRILHFPRGVCHDVRPRPVLFPPITAAQPACRRLRLLETVITPTRTRAGMPPRRRGSAILSASRIE